MEEAQRTLRILSLEDDANDRQLLAAMLSRDGLACDLVFAGSAAEFESAVGREKFDLIVSDFTLPDYDGVSALAAARKAQPETPFVLVSGTIGEERGGTDIEIGRDGLRVEGQPGAVEHGGAAGAGGGGGTQEAAAGGGGVAGTGGAVARAGGTAGGEPRRGTPAYFARDP